MESIEYDLNIFKISSLSIQSVGWKLDNCEVDLEVCKSGVLLYAKTIRTYDLILGMDWLESHVIILDWRSKEINFYDDEGYKRFFMGKKRKVSLQMISALKLKKSMRKGWIS